VPKRVRDLATAVDTVNKFVKPLIEDKPTKLDTIISKKVEDYVLDDDIF